MLDMYTRQCRRASWEGTHSAYFSSSNGVRQGGVVSPVLFTVYMDVLLSQLDNSGVGCYIGHQYFGSVGYAHDLTRLSPSLKGFQKMIDICLEYGNDYGVQYNSKKTMCMLFFRET